jgi:hypothetical protein
MVSVVALGNSHGRRLARLLVGAVRHLVRMLDRRELPAAARRHDRERAHLAALAVVHAGAFDVPAAQLDVGGLLQVDALEGIGRHGELDRVGAALRFGDAFPVGRFREEGRPADLLQVDLPVGIDLSRRIDRAGGARGALLVRRQPALHLRVDALEAGRIFLAGAPAGLELVVGEFADVIVAARVARRRGVGREQQRHADGAAHALGPLVQQVAGQHRVAVGADPGGAVGGRGRAVVGLALGLGGARAGREREQGTRGRARRDFVRGGATDR